MKWLFAKWIYYIFLIFFRFTIKPLLSSNVSFSDAERLELVEDPLLKVCIAHGLFKLRMGSIIGVL